MSQICAKLSGVPARSAPGCQMSQISRCSQNDNNIMYVFLTAKLQILILRNILKFCMKFGHLILRKITKFVATRSKILRLTSTKIDYRWGSAPNNAREVTALPRPPSWI